MRNLPTTQLAGSRRQLKQARNGATQPTNWVGGLWSQNTKGVGG